MNYYKRHIGDYMKDAAHLSLLEHGVYMRLLDVYYTREQPVPVDQAARLIGARSKEEREALTCVAGEFFEIVDGCYTQARCDREIAAMQAKAESNREVGKKGGRPKKVTTSVDSGNPEKTQMVSEQNPNETLATSHKPLTISQEDKHALLDPPLREQDGSEPPDGGVRAGPTMAAAVCVALRAAGVSSCNPGHPKLTALLEAGATVDGFVAAAKALGDRETPPNNAFAYILATVQGQMTDAARVAHEAGNAAAQPAKGSGSSFRERDEEARRRRWEEMHGQPWSEDTHAPRDVIDVTPRPLEIANGTAN